MLPSLYEAKAASDVAVSLVASSRAFPLLRPKAFLFLRESFGRCVFSLQELFGVFLILVFIPRVLIERLSAHWLLR